MIFLLLALVTFEATYTDASQADCAAFAIASREVDLCTGDLNR